MQGADVITDSNGLWDATLRGGRLGVAVYSQENVTFSKLDYKCLEVRYRYTHMHTDAHTGVSICVMLKAMLLVHFFCMLSFPELAGDIDMAYVWYLLS